MPPARSGGLKAPRVRPGPVPWLEAVRWLQRVLPEVVLAAFEVVTHAGSGPAYAAGAGVLALAWDRRRGYILAATLLASSAANVALKAAFAWPRPPERLRRVAARGFGFPSGHAQTNAAFWGTLAWLSPRRRTWAAGAAAVALVAVSRVVLGVHYPRDVAAGVAVGLAVAAAAWAAVRVLEPRLAGASTRSRLAAAVLGPTPAAFAGIYGYGPALAGALAGAGVAYVLEGARLPRRPAGPVPLAAGALLGAAAAAPTLLLPRHPALDWAGAALAAGAALGGGPWLAWRWEAGRAG